MARCHVFCHYSNVCYVNCVKVICNLTLWFKSLMVHHMMPMSHVMLTLGHKSHWIRWYGQVDTLQLGCNVTSPCGTMWLQTIHEVRQAWSCSPRAGFMVWLWRWHGRAPCSTTVYPLHQGRSCNTEMCAHLRDTLAVTVRNCLDHCDFWALSPW
jgi:hypothetical protein